MDFPEEVGEVEREAVEQQLAAVAAELWDLLAQANQGRVVREGLRVVLVGRPNAGKSSLFNALLGQERAIVTAVPGTTRDILEEVVEWHGLPVRLCDTAGLGEPRDAAEAVAVERARELVGRADVVLLVIDGTALDEGLVIDGVARERAVVVVNKADLLGEEARAAALARFAGWRTVLTSAKEGWGLEALREAVGRYARRREEGATTQIPGGGKEAGRANDS